MFLWFAGTAFLAVWFVFRDPAFDHRLVMAGAVLPDLVDALSGGARVLHSITGSVALLTGVMLGTIGRRSARRHLVALPIGTFLHLVFDGAWNDTNVFWWPFTGGGFSFGDARLPSIERGWLTVVMELAGLLMLLWCVRRFDLTDPARRHEFLRTGRLDRELAA